MFAPEVSKDQKLYNSRKSDITDVMIRVVNGGEVWVWGVVMCL